MIVIRAWARVRWIIRITPARVYITLGTMFVPLLVLAGLYWAPVLNFSLIGYGTWRAVRRQRALNGFRRWDP